MEGREKGERGEVAREAAGTRWKGGRKEEEMIESEIVREAAGTR